MKTPAGLGQEAGLTLTELMTVVAISSIMLVIIMRFLATGYPLSRLVLQQAGATETARVQLARITKALRELREADTGSFALVAAEPQRLVFYSDVDSDNMTERLRYELSGTMLERGVIKPSGDPLAYDEADEEVAVVSSHIRNGAAPIFTYFSGDYPADATELTPTDLTEVKYIQFYLLIDVDPEHDPEGVELTSQVQLRNLKTNLGDDAE